MKRGPLSASLLAPSGGKAGGALSCSEEASACGQGTPVGGRPPARHLLSCSREPRCLFGPGRAEPGALGGVRPSAEPGGRGRPLRLHPLRPRELRVPENRRPTRRPSWWPVPQHGPSPACEGASSREGARCPLQARYGGCPPRSPPVPAGRGGGAGGLLPHHRHCRQI